MNFFPFHIGDYAVHTRHLSPMEDLAYRRLLDLYYTHERPIPLEEPAREIGLHEFKEEVVRVLRRFFVETIAGWSHSRCDDEITRMRAKQDNARASVAKRTAHASVTQASSTNTNTNTKKEKTPSVLRARRCPAGWAVPQDVFDQMAAECPRLDLGLESAKFRDWEFKNPRSDWPAAWRTWMRKAKDDLRSRDPPKTFRERDEQVAAARFAAFTGRKPDPLDNIIDMEPANARIGNR